MHYEISYGKCRVPVYRVYGTPLLGLTPIPESAFTGRANVLVASEVDVEVFGDDFLAAYTDGDNRRVVATDSMKNFVLKQALAYEGATLEGFLHSLGRGFISGYEQLHDLHLTGRELPFNAATVPDGNGDFVPSEVLFDRTARDHTVASLRLRRGGTDIDITAHECGRVGLQLLKVTGSSFTSFVRDEYTTLPERRDRPLFIFLDVHWRYADIADLLNRDPARYVAAEQVGDLVRTVFHEFVSESIQHLVHEMGQRILSRFPQLAEVRLAAQNRTHDPFVESATDPRAKVYTDPFSAYGQIALRLARQDL